MLGGEPRKFTFAKRLRRSTAETILNAESGYPAYVESLWRREKRRIREQELCRFHAITPLLAMGRSNDLVRVFRSTDTQAFRT
jgi:hypothetical protein